jgi:mitogen-activated protein kinase kinase kinase
MAPASSAPSRGADEYFPVHGGSTGIVHETLYEDDEASSGSEADAARDGARKASVRFGQLDAADAAAAESDGAGAGPRSLSGRHLSESARSHAADSGGDASGSASPSSSAKRLPAAGAGSRVGPRPVPKDSASLRHISFRSRLSGIPSGSGSSSAAAAEVEPAAATFRRKESRGKMAPDSDEEDSLDDEDDEDEDGSQRNGVGRESWQRDLYGIHKERADRKRNSKAAAVEEQRTRGALSGSSSSEASDGDGEIEEDDGEASDDHRHEGSSSRQLEAPRPDRPGFSNSLAAQAHERRTRSVRRAPWHPRGPLADGENSPLFPPLAGGLTTPGPQWPHGVNTPMGTPPGEFSTRSRRPDTLTLLQMPCRPRSSRVRASSGRQCSSRCLRPRCCAPRRSASRLPTQPSRRARSRCTLAGSTSALRCAGAAICAALSRPRRSG